MGYGLLAALVAVATVIAFGLLGHNLSDVLCRLATEIDPGSPCLISGPTLEAAQQALGRLTQVVYVIMGPVSGLLSAQETIRGLTSIQRPSRPRTRPRGNRGEVGLILWHLAPMLILFTLPFLVNLISTEVFATTFATQVGVYFVVYYALRGGHR